MTIRRKYDDTIFLVCQNIPQHSLFSFYLSFTSLKTDPKKHIQFVSKYTKANKTLMVGYIESQHQTFQYRNLYTQLCMRI